MVRAIKIVEKKQLDNEQECIDEIQEIMALKKFDYPHIVKLCEVHETEDEIYLV